ncbi:MAG: hypothetical protein O2826_11685 [Chloroflexi bacterium]|nr:hypothetical protein [Chloroflexota bacterium]MDA1175160.1 hypothetical protein [Chloroflexota bacterium]
MKYVPKSWTGFVGLIVGVVLILVGLELLEDVGVLHDRTEQRVAVVLGDDLHFTTLAEVDYVVPLDNTCKHAEPPPKRGCIERYADGDEVLVWYDNADPTHMWEGSTPGGGVATSALYAGIILVTFALVTLYAAFVLPRIKQGSARLQEIIRRAPRP